MSATKINPEPLHLPKQYPRQHVSTAGFHSGRNYRQVCIENINLISCAQSHGETLTALCLAWYAVLLQRYTAQESFIVGTLDRGKILKCAHQHWRLYILFRSTAAHQQINGRKCFVHGCREINVDHVTNLGPRRTET